MEDVLIVEKRTGRSTSEATSTNSRLRAALPNAMLC